MSNVLSIVAKIIDKIFVYHVGANPTIFGRMLLVITNNPYLSLGAILLVVGFSVGIVKRLIHA